MGKYCIKSKHISLFVHANCILIAGMLILLVFSVPQSPASGELPPRPHAMVNQVSPTDQTVATVDGHAIKSWKVDYHARSLYLSKEEAMEDL